MSSQVRLDPAAAFPAVAEVRAALAARDWPACRAVLDGAAPDGRQFLIRAGSDEAGLEDFLRGEQDDAAAAVMLGSFLINAGREREAEQVLIDAAARHPGDPAVWGVRLISARGLRVGLAETRRRYDRLYAIDPHNFAGQAEFLQSLCPKWNGTWERLHAWAREAMLAAPEGSPQGALVAEAHIEHWLGLGGAAGIVAPAKAYLANPYVRGELHEAAHRSIGHPDFRRGYHWVRAAGAFAMIFGLIGDREAAASAFAMLGDLGTRHPWSYLGDPEETIRTRRAEATR